MGFQYHYNQQFGINRNNLLSQIENHINRFKIQTLPHKGAAAG